jgi:hypothetical protein
VSDPGERIQVDPALDGLDPAAVVEALAGLPPAPAYRLVVKPLRYRTRPHLSAWTDFGARTITLQVPVPFLPFGEIVQYAARRLPGKRPRFVWLSEGLTFREPREVLRFLYCHEWMHWYLRERLGRKAFAETACDRFALRNYLRPEVTEADATEALARGRRGVGSGP